MKPDISGNRRGLRKYGLRVLAVLIVVIIAVVAILILLGPPVSNHPFTTSLVTCSYQVKVVVFNDTNGNAVQDSGEAGIAGVNVSLQHTLPMKDASPEQTSTDANGLATLGKDSSSCVQQDTLTTTVALPSGYSATTPVTFGPYPVPEFTNEAATQAAQHPIPSVMYVGLRRS